MTYILHHYRNSRSMRVLWLMEEMGLDYELRTKTGPGLKAPDYLALNPLGTVPALEVKGSLIVESGAIIQYLLAQHAPSPFEPGKDDPDFPQYLQWFHFSEATFAPVVVTYIGNAKLKPAADRIEAAATEAFARITILLDYLGGALANRNFVAGERFTAADIMLGLALHVANMHGVLAQAPASVPAYLERLSARPAFGRAAPS